jgi:integrase
VIYFTTSVQFLKMRKLQPKSVRHYSSRSEERCLVRLYKLYLNLIGNEGPFYRKPLYGTVLKFSAQVIGINTLTTLTSKMCKDAGLEGNFSSHSGKRTCATNLYQAGISEELIMQRTGHRSIEGVRTYKRPSSEMLREVSSVLDPPSPPKTLCQATTKSETTIGCKNDASTAHPDTCLQNRMVFKNCVFNF